MKKESFCLESKIILFFFFFTISAREQEVIARDANLLCISEAKVVQNIMIKNH
jgi:hypothetical protein